MGDNSVMMGRTTAPELRELLSYAVPFQERRKRERSSEKQCSDMGIPYIVRTTTHKEGGG